MNEGEKSQIREFVQIWIDTHKEEMDEFVVEQELERLGLFDTKFGKNEGGSMRKYANMPQDLQIKLKKNFPELFQGKESLAWLFKEFPIFLLSEVY